MVNWKGACNSEAKSEMIQASGVIRREFDNLTREDIVKFAKQVNQAKLEELKRWHDMKCFKRISRTKAHNKVDGTWVLMEESTEGN